MTTPMNITAIPTTESPDVHAQTMRIVGFIELVAGFIVGTPLNSFVIYLCTKLTRKRGNNNQWIVLSMTCADLMFTLFHCPLMFGKFTLQMHYEKPLCLFLYISSYVSAIASSLSLLMLNVDKFLYLHKPLHYFIIVTRTKVYAGVGICWAVAISWSLFFLLGPMTELYAPPCDFSPTNLSMYISFLVLFFTVPVFLSLLISIYVATVVVRTRKADRERREKLVRGSSSGPSKGVWKGQSHLRSILFVFSTTIFTAITTIPYRIAYAVLKTSEKDASHTSITISYYLFAVVSMNAVINPVITIVTQRQYIVALRGLWSVCQGDNDSNTPLTQRESLIFAEGKRSSADRSIKARLSEPKPKASASSSGSDERL